jgi:hypothetical protein
VSIMAEACVDLALNGKTLGAAKFRYHARAAREDEKKAHMFLQTSIGVRLTPFLLKNRFEHNLLVCRKYGEDSQDAVALCSAWLIRREGMSPRLCTRRSHRPKGCTNQRNSPRR